MSYSYEELLERSQQIRKLRTLRGHRSHIYDVAFSPNGQLLASAGAWASSTIRLWDVERGEEVNSLVASGNVSCGAFTPDGQWLAFVSDDQKIRLWQIETGLVRDLIGHTDSVRSVLFSPDGQWLASASDDQTVCLWHVESGQPVHVLKGHTNWVLTLSFSPDGQWLASGSADQTVRLWEIKTARQVGILTEHDTWVLNVAFSPDGQLLASASRKTVRLWALESTRLVRAMKHDEHVNCIVWTPNGRVLIARPEAPGDITFWHVESGRPIHTLSQAGQEDGYWATRGLAISPNGQLLVTYAADSINDLDVWDISALEVGANRK